MPLQADAAHADLINNIGVVLTHLPPKSRVRVAKAHGLWPTTAEQHEALIIQHVDNFRAADLDVAVVDGLVESLFRKTLEIDSCHRWALNNLGLHLHSHGRDNEVGLEQILTRLAPRHLAIILSGGIAHKTVILRKSSF